MVGWLVYTASDCLWQWPLASSDPFRCIVCACKRAYSSQFQTIFKVETIVWVENEKRMSSKFCILFLENCISITITESTCSRYLKLLCAWQKLHKASRCSCYPSRDMTDPQSVYLTFRSHHAAKSCFRLTWLAVESYAMKGLVEWFPDVMCHCTNICDDLPLSWSWRYPSLCICLLSMTIQRVCSSFQRVADWRLFYSCIGPWWSQRCWRLWSASFWFSSLRRDLVRYVSADLA